MILELLARQLYVSDDGKVTCSDKNCKCMEGLIEVHGRRVSVGDYLLALEKHFLTYGTK